MPDSDSDPEYAVPMQYKRPFGAGVKRKRINFVPEAAPPCSITDQAASRPGNASVGDVYLSIVMPKARANQKSRELTFQNVKTSAEATSDLEAATLTVPADSTCAICKLPLTSDYAATAATPHEASLAHQVCLAHSHPPSALDRRRKGVTYLSAYGWDPDDRRGLGASGEGRLYPIQPKAREDNRGVGAMLQPKQEAVKEKKMHAGEVRKAEEEKRRKGRRIERLFHADDKVNKYLGLDM